MSRLARALVALFLANGAAVVVIWWAGLDAASLDGLAGRLSALGRITGLVGTYLVLVQLVLRTHVSWLVWAFGKDALKSAHTRNAYIAFTLIGLHAALQVVGYAMADRTDLISELGLLIAHYEGMVLAIAGLALMAALTLLAVDRFHHLLPWPTWRALHLYFYAAVALSLPHQIATGSDFLDAPVAVAYWSALEAAVLAILLAARLPPIWRAAMSAGRPHPAVVAVGALVIAIYLAGTVRLSPTPPPALAVASPSRGISQPGSPSSPLPSPAVPSGSVRTIEGEPIEMQYGSAQVRVVLEDGRIIEVEPMLLPSVTKRSSSISNSVEPWLRKRAIAAQAAQFDVLSGATYTSRAYMASLETALRAAGMVHP